MATTSVLDVAIALAFLLSGNEAMMPGMYDLNMGGKLTLNAFLSPPFIDWFILFIVLLTSIPV